MIRKVMIRKTLSVLAVAALASTTAVTAYAASSSAPKPGSVVCFKGGKVYYATDTAICTKNLPKTVVGPMGPMGPTGPQGVKGDTGATGPQGEKGLKGDDGAKGAAGATGAAGPVGPAGAKGADGKDGKDGTDGVSPTISAVQLDLPVVGKLTCSGSLTGGILTIKNCKKGSNLGAAEPFGKPPTSTPSPSATSTK